MWTLISKDFMIQKKNLYKAGLYPILMFLIFPKTSQQVYAIGTVMITYILLSYLLSIEDNNKAHTFVNSMPVSRPMVVMAKYLIIIAFVAFGYLAMTIMGLIMSLLPFSLVIPQPSWLELGSALALSLVAAGLFLPLNFWLGAASARTAGVLIYITAFFLPDLFLSLFPNSDFLVKAVQWFQSLPILEKSMLVCIPVALLITISYAISTAIYMRKDFAT